MSTAVEDISINSLIARQTERLIQIQKAQLDWKRKHNVYFHRPRGKQPLFHESKAKIRLVYGTNRSGKTTSGVAEDISLVLGFHPWMLPDELKFLPIKELLKLYERREIPPECLTRKRPPYKLLIVEDDWDIADEILISGSIDRPGKLRNFLPPGALDGKPEKNSLGYYYKWNLINGSSIRIDTEKSFTNDPGSFEGTDLDGVHYDEPKKRDLRVALKRGLVDRDGDEIFTLTPLAEPWIKDEIYDKAGINPDIECFYFDAEDLVQESVISKAGWESFKDSLTEDEKEARIHGKWIHLRGLIYKEFSPAHIRQGGNMCDSLSHEWVAKNGTVYAHIDPHPRIPFACLFMVADREGRHICWREIYAKCLIKEFVDLINLMLSYKDSKGQVRKLEVQRWLIDPLAFEQDPIDGHNWADEFVELGIFVEKAPKRKEQGILDTRHEFKEQKLLLTPDVPRTLFEVQHYVWDEWRNNLGNKNQKEKPVDKDDHMMESLYRLILIDPVFVEPEKFHRPIEDVRWCR